LIIEFLLAHGNLITLEIFDTESYSSKFDSVKFLNLVIVFSGFIFERPGDKPKSINALFFLIGGGSSVIEVITFGILLEEAKAACVWALRLINNVIGLVEIYLIIVPYNLALRLSLQTHLDDVA
jgi:hypothetical protein